MLSEVAPMRRDTSLGLPVQIDGTCVLRVRQPMAPLTQVVSHYTRDAHTHSVTPHMHTRVPKSSAKRGACAQLGQPHFTNSW